MIDVECVRCGAHDDLDEAVEDHMCWPCEDEWALLVAEALRQETEGDERRLESGE